MSIAVLMARPIPDERSVARQMIDLLRDWGSEVEEMQVRSRAVSLTELRIDHELYLLTSASPTMISYAASLEAVGARCLNSTEVVRTCRDRVLSTGLLAAHGVPVPQTWTAEEPTDLSGLLENGPIVIKSVTSHDGAGSQVVWDVDELIHLPGRNRPVLAQRFHPSEHRGRKVYRIGEQIFGVKRSWPARTYAEKVGEPFAIDNELRQVTERIGTAIGTDLFGADIVVGHDGAPLVVEVHPFPGFKGVPDAALRLADYVHAVSRGEQVPGRLPAPEGRR